MPLGNSWNFKLEILRHGNTRNNPEIKRFKNPVILIFIDSLCAKWTEISFIGLAFKL